MKTLLIVLITIMLQGAKCHEEQYRQPPKPPQYKPLMEKDIEAIKAAVTTTPTGSDHPTIPVVTPVPIPNAMGLFGFGLLAVAFVLAKKTR